MASFSDILDVPANEVERPKPVPVGTYLATVIGNPRQDKSAKKGTEFLEYTLKLNQAMDDVDQEALEAAGGLENKTMKTTYYLTDTALWRLKDFLVACGALEDDAETKLSEAAFNTQGSQLLVNVIHKPSQDGTALFANVGSVAPVE